MTTHNTRTALQSRARTDPEDAGNSRTRRQLRGAELERELENVALEELEAAAATLDRILREGEKRC